MSVLVVDASVAAKWFAEEEHAEQARRLGAGHELHAPDFLLIEMDNIFCTWVRNGSFLRADADEARAVLRRSSVQLHAFQPLLDGAYWIAGEWGLSIYDALYIALAVSLDAPLVTADRKFCRVLARGPLAKSVLWVEDAAAPGTGRGNPKSQV